MTSRNTKRILKALRSLPHPPIRPNRSGTWWCLDCETFNQATVTVIPTTDTEPAIFTVDAEVACKRCGHTFEALAPVPGAVLVPPAT